MSGKHDQDIIPKDAAGDLKSWSLPTIDDARGVISVEKHGSGGRFRQVKKTDLKRSAGLPGSSTKDPGANPNAQKSPQKNASAKENRQGESIEDVDPASVQRQPFTAQQLQDITDAAEKEGFAQGHQEGFKKGMEEGRIKGIEDGKRQGQAIAAKEAAQQVGYLQAIAEQLIDPIGEQSEQLERLMVNLVCTLTRQLVAKELTTDSGDILGLVHEAMATLPVGAKHIRLYLNPDDLAVIESYAQETHQDWQFIGDQKMLPGGCKIKSSESLVDFSIETRLAHLLEQFTSRQLASETDDGFEPEDFLADVPLSNVPLADVPLQGSQANSVSSSEFNEDENEDGDNDEMITESDDANVPSQAPTAAAPASVSDPEAAERSAEYPVGSEDTKTAEADEITATPKVTTEQAPQSFTQDSTADEDDVP